MYGFEGIAIVLLVVAIGTPIVALIALSRTSELRDELKRLRAEVAALKRADRQSATPRPETLAAERPISPPPQPAPAARATPPPAAKPPPLPTPPSADPAPTEPQAAAPAMDWTRASATFERFVVSNWLVWVGALALALGGVFLVRFAWEQGYFGPEARTITALLAGLAMIAGSEWLRRRSDPDAPGQLPYAPLAVGAAGAITLYVSAYAAGPLYDLVPPMVALAGFVLAAAVAVALAVVHGVFLAVLGFIGGYLAPILVGGGQPEPLLVLGYVLAVTLAAMVLVRAFDWKQLVWVALGGAALWTLAGIFWINLGTGPLALTIYVLALVAASSVLAWDDAAKAIRAASQTVIVANGFWLIALAGLVMPLLSSSATGVELLAPGILVYAAGAIFAGWRREGFRLTPLLGAAALGAAALILPPFQPVSGWWLIIVLWVGAVITGFGGWFTMRAMNGNGVMAVVSAFTPIVLLAIGFVRIGEFGQGFQWGMGGGLLALLNLLALEGLSRAPGRLDARRVASSAYALGAFAASMFAVAASLQQMWMTALFALHLPAIALIDRRFNLPALRLAASIAGLVVSARLLFPLEVLSYPISPTPILNELLPLFGVPILSFWAAARIFEQSLKDPLHRIVQAMDVAAIVLGAALLSVEVRHLVTGGNLAAGFEGLVEVGAYCFAWAALAIGLSARQGQAPRPWLRITTQLVTAVAIAIAVLGLGLRFNPLLDGDLQTRTLDGPLFLNLMTPSYLAPAALLAALSQLKRRQNRITEGHVAGFVGLALVFLYVSLEVRNYFHAEMALSAAPVEEAESYAYSVTWILFAVVTLFVGIARRRVSIRHAAMGVLALSVVKVFLFDMASLDGVLRAASFFGLGIALIGIALLYQKLIFGREPVTPDAP